MKEWWKIAFAAAISLLGAGAIYLASSQPRGQPVELLPPPTAAPLQVYVSGAVAEPDVYSLAPGSRVRDAIQAAGGVAPEANAEALNQAEPLADGQRVYVPFLPTPAPTAPPGAARSSAPILPAPTTNSLININTATQAELETLPGIGPITAEKIIAYREANGPFARIEDIEDVDGIGPKKFEAIMELITVDDY